VTPKLWSDENRLFIPRMGGWTINFKYIARKLGWVKPIQEPPSSETVNPEALKTAEDRLEEAVERSRYEDE